MWSRARETDTGWVGAGPDDDLDRRLEAEEEPFDLGRPHVRTLLGPIVPEALGPTLVGEPLGALAQRIDGRLQGVAAKDALLAELEDAYAAGVRSVVARVTSPAEIDDMMWLAARTPVHLVASASADLAAADPDRSVGAVSIEIADGGPPDASTTLAGELHRHRVLPVEVHGRDTVGLVKVVRSLMEHGVKVHHVWAGGCDWGTNEGTARELLDLGVAVSFGVVGSLDEEMDCRSPTALIAGLARAGHADRLLLGSGIERPDGLRVGGGRFGLGGVVERFPLVLLEGGVEAVAVRRMLIDGPAQVLTIEAQA